MPITSVPDSPLSFECDSCGEPPRAGTGVPISFRRYAEALSWAQEANWLIPGIDPRGEPGAEHSTFCPKHNPGHPQHITLFRKPDHAAVWSNDVIIQYRWTGDIFINVDVRNPLDSEALEAFADAAVIARALHGAAPEDAAALYSAWRKLEAYNNCKIHGIADCHAERYRGASNAPARTDYDFLSCPMESPPF